MAERRPTTWRPWTPKYRERLRVWAVPEFVRLRQKQELRRMQGMLRQLRVLNIQDEISNILHRQNPVLHCIWDDNGSVRLPGK